MKILFGIFCIAVVQIATGQRVIDVSKDDVRIGTNIFYSVGGTPFVNAKFVALVEGTPYFRDEWLKGSIVMPAGTEYKDVSLKIDLFDNQLHYLDNKNIELVADVSIKEVMLTDALGSTYRFVHSSFIPQTTPSTKKSWYQLLSLGTASLYKSFSKLVSESTPYGSATTEQKMRTTETYLVHYNNAFLEIKKIKDASDVLANKKKEVEEFLKNKDNKSLSLDERFTALITYYNTLIKD